MDGMEDREFRPAKQYEKMQFPGIGLLFPSEPIAPHDLVEADLWWDSVEIRDQRKEQKDQEKGQYAESGNPVRVGFRVQPGDLVPDRMRPQQPVSCDERWAHNTGLHTF
jgi:hypothetical protein